MNAHGCVCACVFARISCSVCRRQFNNVSSVSGRKEGHIRHAGLGSILKNQIFHNLLDDSTTEWNSKNFWGGWGHFGHV